MAAEYEVNIKINSSEVVADLNKVDGKVKSISKSAITQGKTITTQEKALARIVDKRARLMNRINELESKGLNVAKLRKQMGKATELQSRKDLANAEKEYRVLNRSIQRETSKLRILRNQAAAARERAKFLAGAPVPGLGGRTFGPSRAFAGRIASPVGGTAGTPGSPEFNRALEIGRFRSTPIGGRRNIAGSPAARRARRQRIEQVGLGAGFPLLFGGGPGSVLGGAAGGLTGSFGAQIAFSAIGQQIDQFIASVAEAGKAFGSLEGVLNLMSERSLFTSKRTEELAEQLKELGDVEALAELATIELASKIGAEGIGAFQDLETELDEFDRLVGNLMISLQAFLAGPLSKFLDIVNSVLGKKVTQGTVNRLAESLQDPADQAAFRAAAKQRIGTELELQGFGMGGLPKSAEVLKSAPLDLLGDLSREVAEGKFGKSNLLSRRVKITRQDRESFKPDPKRGAAQLQKRLDKLDVERRKVLSISRFKDKIAAAEATGNKQLVIRLKGEQRIEEIEASRLDDLVGVTTQREKDKINILKATEKLAAHRDVERELGELQRARQEKFKDTIEDLDHQLALARATTDEERDRLRIERQLAVLKKDGMQDSELAEVKVKMELLAQENTPLSLAVKGVREEINNLHDPVRQLISLSETVGSAFSESFRGIVSGSMTAREALANLFQRTANHFFDMAAQMISAQIRMKILGIGMNFFGGGATPMLGNTSTFSSAFSNPNFFTGMLPGGFGAQLPGRASGGPVGAGQPYMVGERGPELFVPGAQGNIIPNNAMGGTSIVVNVDASGSSVEGDADQSRQLGKLLGAAVQAELIKQKRPGGLLTV